MRNLRHTTLSLILIAIAGALPNTASGQSSNWAVFYNCNASPCVLGVAVSSWYQPGWSRMTTYPNEALAWGRACFLHYNDTRYRSPDIESGVIDCSRY